MTAAETIDLLQAIAAMASAALWPAVAAFAVWLFRRPIRKLLSSDEVAITLPGGIEVAATRHAAASSLEEATREKQLPPISNDAAFDETSVLDEAVREHGAVRILWVDDQPSNNRAEREALEKLGIVVELALSTDAALVMLARSRFDLVISDMGRPEGAQAGYDLLDAMRGRGDETGLIFYTSSRSAVHFDEAVRRSALGCTNAPRELLQMVASGIRSGRTLR
jgi:CheY-like chemotaxis protein